MNNSERLRAIMNYENYDRLPLVHFGYWNETLLKWHMEGHITADEATKHNDGNEYDQAISGRLGFDFCWGGGFGYKNGLMPEFKEQDIETLPNGMIKCLDANGAIVLKKPGIVSIPAEVGHLLTDRESYNEHYRHRLQFSTKRIDFEQLEKLRGTNNGDQPLCLQCGSLFGIIRNYLGVEGVSYLYADDEELYDEIIQTVAEIDYQCLEYILQTGVKFDFANFWEDICFKNGPLVIPSVFEEKIGPHYKRITDLLKKHDINIISLDCDGKIDALVPIWLKNGVNTMFPIEVGTWNASIKPWREKYGREILGVGGMNKNVFSLDYAAIDREIERLKPLIGLGGYIPCPDHRIAPDAKWENVQYYCERMRQEF